MTNTTKSKRVPVSFICRNGDDCAWYAGISTVSFSGEACDHCRREEARKAQEWADRVAETRASVESWKASAAAAGLTLKEWLIADAARRDGANYPDSPEGSIAA